MKRRLLASLAFLAFASLCLAQGTTERKITLDGPAASADKVLASLSKVAGVQFMASAAMSKEVLLIHVKDVSLLDLARKIAEVTSGAWEKSADAYVLVPDGAARAKEDQDWTTARLEAVKRTLATLKGRAKAEGVPSPDGEDSANLSSGDKKGQADPDGAEDLSSASGPFQPNPLIDKLLLQVDPAVIATLQPHQRVVLASSPTSLQLQLPPIDPADITALIKSREEISKTAVQAVQPDGGEIPEELQDAFSQLYKPISGTPAEAIVVVSQSAGLMAHTAADLILYDSKGNVVYSGRESLDPTFGHLKAITSPEQEKEDAKSGAGKTREPAGVPIKFTDKDLFFEKLFGAGAKTNGPPNLTPEQKAVLFDPADNEPLDFGLPTAFKAVADEKNEQLVADLPDSLQGGLDSVHDLKDGMTTTDFRHMLKSGEVVKLDEGAGWLCVSPKLPAKERSERFDRTALSRLIQSCQARGSASLDDLAEYAFSSAEPTTESLSSIYLVLGVPGAMSPLTMGLSDWQTLRFYGALGQAQKEILRNGQSLSPSGMNADQIACLRNMVYGDDAEIQVAGMEPKKAESLLGRLMTMGIGSFSPSQQTTYLQEPTESLPQGLAPSTAVTETIDTSPAVKLVDTDNPISSALGAMDTETYALFKVMLGMSPMPNIPKLDKLLLGQRATYHLRFQLLKGVYMTRDLHEDFFSSDAQPIAADALPDSFKAAVEKATQDMKQMHIGVSP